MDILTLIRSLLTRFEYLESGAECFYVSGRVPKYLGTYLHLEIDLEFITTFVVSKPVHPAKQSNGVRGLETMVHNCFK